MVLVRHGESGWNAQGRWQGHGGVGLTARGRKQAEAVASYLASAYPDIVAVVRSDLLRVVETALPAVSRLDVPVRVDRAWREIDVGWWSGHRHDDIRALDPAGYQAWRAGADPRRGGGETDAELRVRVRQALERIRGTEPPGTVVVYTHGGPVRLASTEVLGLPEGHQSRLRGVENCSLTVLEDVDGTWRLACYNAEVVVD